MALICLDPTQESQEVIHHASSMAKKEGNRGVATARTFDRAPTKEKWAILLPSRQPEKWDVLARDVRGLSRHFHDGEGRTG